MTGTDGKVGGINVQLYLWAKELMEQGWEVYTFDIDKAHVTEGIHFLPQPRSAGLAGLTFWLSVRKILKQIRPSLVIIRGSKTHTNYEVALLCRKFGIGCVYMGASDKDLDFSVSSFSDRIIKRLALGAIKIIPYVLAQNQYQAARFKDMGKDKVAVIPNIWSKEISRGPLPDFPAGYYLWVANFRALKRPEWVVDIARMCPDSEFVMIGAPYEDGVYEKCEAAAASLPNLHFLGPKDFFTADRWFDGARAVICTSEYEGFPNTFLQAWSRNIPVLSTVNPNGLIDSRSLGVICNTPEEFADTIKHWESHPEASDTLRDSIEDYFAEAHSPQKAYHTLMNLVGL